MWGSHTAKQEKLKKAKGELYVDGDLSDRRFRLFSAFVGKNKKRRCSKKNSVKTGADVWKWWKKTDINSFLYLIVQKRAGGLRLSTEDEEDDDDDEPA